MAGFTTARANAILDSELATIYIGLHLLGTGTTVTFTSGTDVVNETAHGRSNGDVLLLRNDGGALPTGLNEATEYFIVNANANDYQLSLTKGGSAVDFSDNGTGTNQVHAGLDDTASGQSEISDTNYARQLVNWASASARRKESNAAEIFPDGGSNGFAANVGLVAWLVGYDAVTAGNKIFYAPLDAYKDLQANDKYEIASGNLDVILNTNPASV